MSLILVLSLLLTSNQVSMQCSHIAAKAFGRLSLLMTGFLTSDVDPSLQNICSSHTGVQGIPGLFLVLSV